MTLTPALVSTTARVVLFAMCSALVATDPVGAAWGWLALIAVVALVAHRLPPSSAPARFGRLAESLVAAVAAIATARQGQSADSFLPYLAAPTFAGGLARGPEGVAMAGFSALVLLAGGFLGPPGVQTSGYAIGAAEWLFIAVILGAFGAWVRRLLRPTPEEASENAYVSAYRLLSQLRPVARQLSVGLDPITIAQGMLADLAAVVPFDRAAVYARTGGDRLSVLAHHGHDGVPGWDVVVQGRDSPFAEAWVSQRPTVTTRTLDGSPGSAVVLPLRIGLRSFGLVGIESSRPHQFDSATVTRTAECTDTSALRLETALLFDDVRGMATVEERRRLAREIHDGIAQELSGLGYVLDDLAEQAAAGRPVHAQLLRLRGEMSRVVNELRLSIYDLRSEVEAHGGLGAALSEYVRSVGRSSGLTVHLSLREGEARVSADVEAELLRIAQEAITNCRKHAEATNLWVTLDVQAPWALLRVEDDGRGVSTTQPRDDSYGLEIMRERAARLRANLRVANRDPVGTVVEVTVADREDRGSLVGADHDLYGR